MKIKNLLIIGIVLFILIGQMNLVSADCISGTEKCEGNNVMRCSEGNWILFIPCIGSTPVCSGGTCISQEEADAIISGFQDSDFLDFGLSFMDIAAGKIWGTEEGIEHNKIGEDGNRFSFTGENASLYIGKSAFENILSQSQADHPSYIETDNFGNITKADFTVNEEGGIYSINGIDFEIPGNSRVRYDSETGFKFPEGTEVKKVGSSVRIDGKDFKLWRGEKQYDISGILDFDSEGNAFVPHINRGEGVEVNGVLIRRWNAKIFFDGKEHEGEYVSFGEKKIISTVSLNFKEKNPYIKIGEENIVYIQALGSLSESKFIVENRDYLGLIPKVTTSSSSDATEYWGSWLDIQNGKQNLHCSPGWIWVDEKLEKNIGSSPIELVGSYGKLFFDNSGRFVLVSEGVDTREIAENEGIDVKSFSRIKHNYDRDNQKNFKRLTGSEIAFLGDVQEKDKQKSIKMLENYLGTLTPETKEAIEKIEILTSEKMKEIHPYATAYSMGDWMSFKSGDFSLETFRHEAAHVRHDALDDVNALFSKQWKKVAGNYDKVKFSESFRTHYYKEKPVRSVLLNFPPSQGYVRPYGGSELVEDVATFVEEINNPKFFKPLLSEKNEWHEIYRGKLDLLYEYKFISEEEYNNILEVAGVR